MRCIEERENKKATTVIPAQAGIHKFLILNAYNKLDSGLRRNDEFLG